MISFQLVELFYIKRFLTQFFLLNDKESTFHEKIFHTQSFGNDHIDENGENKRLNK